MFFIGDITNELWQLSLSLAFNLILFYNHLKLLVFSATLKCDAHEGTTGGKGPHTDEFEVDQRDVEKLAKLCGMLGSNHIGERASAALKASEFLKTRNLTWRDIVFRAFKVNPPPPFEASAPHWSELPRTDAEWWDVIKRECWNHRGRSPPVAEAARGVE